MTAHLAERRAQSAESWPAELGAPPAGARHDAHRVVKVHGSGTQPPRGARFSEDGAADRVPMLCVPLWARPAHVMKLRPIGIANALDQLVPPRGDHSHRQAAAKR